ncbi:MAG: hypothetical protein JWO93_669 [Micrococcaceae bacterium]|nr:hypothetical protein [Micrococcaceae bacterium]
MMHILVLADLGQPEYHAGDEAMAHAAVDELTARLDARITVLSRDPDQSRSFFGTDALHTILFPWPPRERQEHFQRVQRALGGDRAALPADDTFWAVEDAVRTADGVLLAGGGNLNSIYGWLLYERITLALLAAKYGKPLVVSGQTLGPGFLPGERDDLATALGTAALVGLRDPESAQLVSDLAIAPGRSLLVTDDATFLAGVAAAHNAGRQPHSHRPYIAATVAPPTEENDDGRYLAELAAVLDTVAEATGLDILLVPHVGSLSTGSLSADSLSADSSSLPAPRADQLSHQQLVELQQSGRIRALPLLPAREVAVVTRGAELVLTSRYHPAVFALAAGVPTVALTVDTYSDIRLLGAMGNWGMQDFVVPLPGLYTGAFSAAIDTAWQHRSSLRAGLLQAVPMRRSEAAQWWDAAALALSGGNPVTPPSLQALPSLAEALPALAGAVPPWQNDVRSLRPWFRALSSTAQARWLDFDQAQSDRTLLERGLAKLRAADSQDSSLLRQALRGALPVRAAAKAGRTLRKGLNRD